MCSSDLQQAEAARIESDRLAREADKNHKAKINRQALADLVAIGLSEDQAKAVVKAIVSGKVSNVSISY